MIFSFFHNLHIKCYEYVILGMRLKNPFKWISIYTASFASKFSSLTLLLIKHEEYKFKPEHCGDILVQSIINILIGTTS